MMELPEKWHLRFYHLKSQVLLLMLILLLNFISCKKEPCKILVENCIIDSFEINFGVNNINHVNVKNFYDSGSMCEYLVYLRRFDSTLFFYNINFKKLQDSFQFENFNNVIDFKIVSFKEIYLMRSNGDIIKTNFNHDFQQLLRIDTSTIHLDTVILFPAKYQPLEIFNGNFLMYWSIPENINNRKDYLKYFSSGRDLVFESKNNKLMFQKTIGHYPSDILKKNYYVPTLFRTIVPDYIIYSSSHSSDFEVNRWGGTTQIKKLNNPLFHKPTEFNSEKVFDFNYIAKYSIENDGYYDFEYLPETKNYLRIQLLKMNYSNSDGTINEPLERPWIILVLNNDFEIINYLYCVKNKYDYRSFIAIDNKFLILNKNLINGRFKYYVCEIP